MKKSRTKIIMLILNFIFSLNIFSCRFGGSGFTGGEILLNGEFNNERFASSLDFVGDINGDGNTDIAVGAPNNSLAGENAGCVYLFLGPFDASQKSKTPDVRIYGRAGTKFGSAITGGFDVNGDGISDFAVGSEKSSYGSVNNGDVFIFFGNSLSFAAGTDQKDALELSSIRIKGSDIGPGAIQSKGFGTKLGNIGDFDRDGLEDLGVGAPLSNYGSASSTGVLFLFLSGRSFGSPKEMDAALADYVFVGERSNDEFGSSFDYGLNLDAQGTPTNQFNDDFIVGAPGASEGEGRAYVFLGPSSKFVNGVNSAGLADGTLQGESGDLSFAQSLTHLMDIDGDGMDDLAVSSYSNTEQKIYLFYGRDTEAPLNEVAGIIEGGALSESSSTISSSNRLDDVAFKGSLNVGAPLGGPSGLTQGAVYYFSGKNLKDFPKNGAIARNIMESSIIFSNPEGLAGGEYGSTLSGDGDVDSDGNQDLLIGSPKGGLNGPESGFAVLEF